ncbi:(2Fe-2S)-binding protein, partial [bacterium]
RGNAAMPLVSIPYEFTREEIRKSDLVTVLDTEGIALAELEVQSVHSISNIDRTLVVQVQAPHEIASRIAGIRVQEPSVTQPLDQYIDHIADDMIVCRCERVTAGELRELIRHGYRDMNEIKIVTRAGMGACGSKTCNAIIHRLFKEEGIANEEITEGTKRPVFVEVSLGTFAGEKEQE